MAKRLVKWLLDGSTLKMAKPLEDPKAVAEIQAEFDLTKLFPTFGTLATVQQQLIVYGVKQKLMDTGADDVGNAKGKVESAKATWAELIDGKWKGDRINATGAAENKRIAGEAKELMKDETSLMGLMLKKQFHAAEFTPENEAKLQELMLAAAKIDAGRKAKNANAAA